ncbi:MAG: hypothetical protein CL928_07940 [Deltaproteobacteria bacterium]|nr:hypothetical protein [Deltaproteobacteria bacterium]
MSVGMSVMELQERELTTVSTSSAQVHASELHFATWPSVHNNEPRLSEFSSPSAMSVGIFAMLLQSTVGAGPTQVPLLLMISVPATLMLLASTAPPETLSALVALKAQGTAATSWRGDRGVPSTAISSHKPPALKSPSSSGVCVPRVTV